MEQSIRGRPSQPAQIQFQPPVGSANNKCINIKEIYAKPTDRYCFVLEPPRIHLSITYSLVQSKKNKEL